LRIGVRNLNNPGVLSQPIQRLGVGTFGNQDNR
jgi:hypothetical protein